MGKTVTAECRENSDIRVTCCCVTAGELATISNQPGPE